MADIRYVTRLLNGIQRQIDLALNSLIVGSIKIGGTTNSELTKGILDNLITLQTGSDASALHNHNTTYFTKTQLSSITNALGASLVGVEDAGNYYAGLNIEAALQEAGATNVLQATGISSLQTLSGRPANSVNHGAFSGVTIPDNVSTNAALQALETSLETKAADNIVIKKDGSVSYTANQPMGGFKLTGLAAPSANGEALRFNELGIAGGIATLDGAGKVPLSQLPSAIMEYQGVWNASTNSPTLADFISGSAAGTSVGDVYRVSVAGTQNLGSGAIVFDIGDYAILNSTGKWEKSDTTDAVASVNGFVGIVSLTTTNINEGTNLYYTTARFDTGFAGKTTTNLTEGTNLYFTTSRARTAAVVNSTAGAETDQAASVSSMKSYVATQIATKDQAVEISYDPSTSLMAATNVQTAIDELDSRVDAITAAGIETISRPAIAGEAFAAATLFAVRWGIPASAETAGRVYKADKDASVNDRFFVDGIALTSGAVSAAGAMTMVKIGKLTATAHGFTVGLPLYLSASGALTQTAPSSANEAVVRVGKVQDANTLDIQIAVTGVN